MFLSPIFLFPPQSPHDQGPPPNPSANPRSPSTPPSPASSGASARDAGVGRGRSPRSSRQWDENPRAREDLWRGMCCVGRLTRCAVGAVVEGWGGGGVDRLFLSFLSIIRKGKIWACACVRASVVVFRE